MAWKLSIDINVLSLPSRMEKAQNDVLSKYNVLWSLQSISQVLRQAVLLMWIVVGQMYSPNPNLGSDQTMSVAK